MYKRKVLFGALLFCLAGLVGSSILHHRTSVASRSVLSGIPTGDSRNSPLKVEIKLAQDAVKNKETFPVATTLINSGSKEWELGVGCGFLDQWVSDNPSIRVIGEACAKTIAIGARLKPGEAYKRAVPVRVELASGEGQPESVTFRLGFKDMTYGTAPMSSPIWSNAVTVSVTR